MSAERLTRRGFLGLGALVTFAGSASARGRGPMTGKLSFRVPWPVATIDPHRQSDPAALLFGGALFDTLYVMRSDAPYPSLAEGLPERTSTGCRVPLRGGVTTAAGRAIRAREVVQSLGRARGLDGKAWLASLGTLRAEGDSAILVSSRDADRVARTLASPLTAVVPPGFSPERPDGSGPFLARADEEGVTLVRNPRAASGPAYLDEVRIGHAHDLSESLRAFESGEDDLGWLGMGVHEPRKGAAPFDLGVSGWAILRTGKLAGRWSAPGVAQRLVDGVDPERLAFLSPGASSVSQPDEGWGGPPSEVVVREDAPWLVELARVLAATLSRPGHELTVRALSASEHEATVAGGAFALAVDVARPFDGSPLGIRAGLVAAEDARRAAETLEHPPRTSPSPREITRLLRFGVVAEIRWRGGRAGNLVLPVAPVGYGPDLGSAHRGVV